MSERVAIGSSDGEWIDQHFGNCQQFIIYDVSDDNQWEQVEVRKNDTSSATGQHQVELLKQTMSLLTDCSIVLVGRIGPGPKHDLKEAGTEASTDFISIKHAQERMMSQLKR